MNELIYATLRLFHAVPLQESPQSSKSRKPDNAAHLRHGFLLTKRTVDSCPTIETPHLLKFLERQFGYDAVAMNRGLHKNFHEIADWQGGFICYSVCLIGSIFIIFYQKLPAC